MGRLILRPARAVTARILLPLTAIVCAQSAAIADAFAIRPEHAPLTRTDGCSSSAIASGEHYMCALDTSSFVNSRPLVSHQPTCRSGTGNNGCSARSSTSLRMCICINCARVTSCQGYHFVESMHSQPHMDADPKFDPQDGSPTIHVNYRTVMSDRAESEYERMLREHKAEEMKAEAAAGVASANGDGSGTTNAGRTCEVDDNGQPLHGEEKYDLSPVTTVEYDVVECADYVEDMGAWVRNMPEEIRKANPNFVPT